MVAGGRDIAVPSRGEFTIIFPMIESGKCPPNSLSIAVITSTGNYLSHPLKIKALKADASPSGFHCEHQKQ